MIIKLSSILKIVVVILAVIAVSLFAFRFVRLERRVSDMDFRVMTINRQLALSLEVKPTPVATPTPVPTPKLKVK